MNGLYTAASALDTFRLRQEAIAHNLANTQTVGFKRVQVRTKSFATALDNAQVIGEARIDFTQGDLVHTGEPLDVGLDGEGFFVVETDRGLRYTRAGTFRRSAEGNLITASGEQLMSTGGVGVALGDAPLNEIQILGDGRVVTTAGAAAGGNAALKVVLLEGSGQLVSDGTSLFRPEGEQYEVPSEAKVRQGFRERSNAEPVNELLNMIEVHRMFESATQSIQAASRALEQTSSEVI